MVATKETRRVGRARKHEPDFNTPPGQWALWLLYKKPDISPVELAIACGAARSAGFRWLNGENIASPEFWPAIATYCGMKNWTQVVPPLEFVAYLARYRRLPPAGKF